MAIGQGLLDVWAVISETFPESARPIPAPLHSPEVIRQRQYEKDRK
jgi:hypothetical protein